MCRIKTTFDVSFMCKLRDQMMPSSRVNIKCHVESHWDFASHALHHSSCRACGQPLGHTHDSHSTAKRLNQKRGIVLKIGINIKAAMLNYNDTVKSCNFNKKNTNEAARLGCF